MDVIWLEDDGKILLINESALSAYWLEGEEALVWAWLNSGMTIKSCHYLMSALTGNAPSEIRARMLNFLKRYYTMCIGNDHT